MLFSIVIQNVSLLAMVIPSKYVEGKTRSTNCICTWKLLVEKLTFRSLGRKKVS